VHFEGGLVVGVLGAEGGHPHRAGIAHLVEQRAQVSIVDRQQRDN
jgi:hypothetical protein